MDSLFKLIIQDADIVVPDTGMHTSSVAGSSVDLSGAVIAGVCLALMFGIIILKRAKHKKKAYAGLIVTMVTLLLGASVVRSAEQLASAMSKKLNISVSDTITATIDRSKGESYVVVPVDVTLNEASTNGYDLYMYGGALTDGTNTISQVSSDGVAISDGTWGVVADGSETVPEISDTRWGQIGSSSAPKKVYTISSDVAAGTTLRIYYGVSIDNDIPAGTYETTINFAMKHEVAATLEDAFEEAEIPQIPVGPDPYYPIQAMTTEICDNATVVPSTLQVVDTRDNTIYTIGKLADGRCWLLDNLALDPLADGVVINEGNTNAPAEAITNFLEGSQTAPHEGWSTSKIAYTYRSGGTNYTEPKIFEQQKNKTIADMSGPADTLAEASTWKFGIYYNYCAASMGTYCFEDSQGRDMDPNSNLDTKYDICPAGWRLPTGGSNGEYKTLYDLYIDYNDPVNPSHPFRKALHLPISGYVSYMGPENQGSYVSYWTATYPESDNQYYMQILYQNAPYEGSPTSANSRYYGYGVRCIAK